MVWDSNTGSAPFMRAEGITYSKIHEVICAKGYDGTVASLCMFMQKERAHRKSVSSMSSEQKEYTPRKFMCQIIYRELEKVKGITQEQYDCAIKIYPMLGQLYAMLKEFHRIVFSQKSDELDEWLIKSNKLDIDEINTYISGLKKDLDAVKNGIHYKYNSGLADKRIMYGRNSFQLIKAKVLLNEYFHQFN